MNTQRGDIYILGNHRLGCLDSVKDDITPLINGAKVRVILTDPPYGVAYVENKQHFKGKDDETQISVDREIANDQLQTAEEYSTFCQGWLGKIAPHLDTYNAAYIFNADLMMCALRDGFSKAGFYYSQTLIWVKNTVVVGRKDWLPQHELILYGWYGRHKFEHGKDKTVILCPDPESSVLFAPKPAKSKLHPTMKPVELLRKILLNATKIGEIVYDPFGGSGSTLIACEHTRRVCLMTELDPVYCDRIVRRWEKLTGKKAIKL